jgi:type I restriction enzyme S subunit
MRLDDVMRVQPPPGGEGARTAVETGDVLISITADLGIMGVAPPRLGEAYVNQHIALVRLDPARADPIFVATFLAEEAGQRQIYRLNDPGAKAGLNLPAVGNLIVALPPLPEQRRIAAILRAQDARIVREEQLAAKLRLLRAGLLEEVMCGRADEAVDQRSQRVLIGAAA